MFRSVRTLVILGALAIGGFGCSNGAQPPDNPDVVATVPAQAFSFAEAATYVLPEDVVEIVDPAVPAGIKTMQSLNSETKQLILSQIVAEMTERGYVRLTDPAGPKPDIFIQTSVMRTTSTQVYYDYWYGYWGGYYDPWYGGYSAGWAPYPVPYVVTSTLGTLIIEFTNPNNPDPTTQQIPSIWAGVVTGVVDDSPQIEIQSRIQSGIDQAFEQSPYIRRQP